jgi:hypothetical protein
LQEYRNLQHHRQLTAKQAGAGHLICSGLPEPSQLRTSLWLTVSFASVEEAEAGRPISGFSDLGNGEIAEVPLCYT